MTEINAFIELFGDITLFDIVVLILALAFVASGLKKVKTYATEIYESKRSKDEQLKALLQASEQNSAHREASEKVQNELREDIQKLYAKQDELVNRLTAMEDERKRLEINKLRDRLIENYRYFINVDNNPTHSWTIMESEAFWNMFHDYESLGGNGYIHSVVQPAMEGLTVLDLPNRSHPK